MWFDEYKDDIKVVKTDKIIEEFGKRCQLCGKNRESHMYPFPVNGKYRRLCKDCWEKILKEVANEMLEMWE